MFLVLEHFSVNICPGIILFVQPTCEVLEISEFVCDIDLLAITSFKFLKEQSSSTTGAIHRKVLIKS